MIRILKESETKREAIFAREDPVANVEEPVRAILEDVEKNGDEALKRYTKEFDGADISTVQVGMGDVEEGFRRADPVLVEILCRAVDRIAKTDGEFSLEERMGCGFGACMGCSCRTRDGMKRICREGPVLRRGEILWEK